MLKHLELFLGSRKQLLDHYMIRFKPDNEVEFLATDGHSLCLNWINAVHCGANGSIVAITPEDFNQILMFEGSDLSFVPTGTDLTVFCGELAITVNTLDPSSIPDIDTIVSLPSLEGSRPYFRPGQLMKIAKYCKRMGSEEVRFGFAGDRLPMKICDISKKWVIYMMPIGAKKP